MKIIEKQWFIERIRPYLMPGEGVREGAGCVKFHANIKPEGAMWHGDTLYIHSPTHLCAPRQNAVCHLQRINEGAPYATIEPLTPRRSGKNAKELLLDDFLRVSGLEGRDLEACRRARTRKKIAFSGHPAEAASLVEAGHTIIHLAPFPDEARAQMKMADAFVYFDCHEELFNLGMAYAFEIPDYSTHDMSRLLEVLDK